MGETNFEKNGTFRKEMCSLSGQLSDFSDEIKDPEEKQKLQLVS
ncbi:MAG: hypothetical protein PVH61_35345 [Candidatus Aminicenantes bacterium]|jgi:hypothetical protein